MTVKQLIEALQKINPDRIVIISKEQKMKVYLLSVSDRDSSEKLTLGIFASEKEAWDHYYAAVPGEHEQYLKLPHIEKWKIGKGLYFDWH
jgi:hypothetical protein